MSSLFSSLGCCFWWLLLGALIGWLAHCWLRKCCGSKPAQNVTSQTPPPPAAKVADVPAAAMASPSAPTAPAMKATPSAKPKTAAKPKAAPKPKTAAKPKAATKPKVASIDLAAAKAAGFAIKNANDLTVIEGIGPKINDLFIAAGLKTFAQVAKATVPQMRAILDKGGSRFRIANPSTWAQQAALANGNKWTELKKLQDELSAGLKK